jgi:uncharacterized phiE125 gp8 family phage protein
MIRCVVVTPPAGEPVTVAEAKLWLRLDADETADDGVVAALIPTARQRLEEAYGRAFIRQTFDAYLSDTPCEDYISLPRAPLVSVTSVKGFSSTDLTDTGGTAMNSTGYYVDTATEPGRVVLLGSDAWPTGTRAANPLIVRFVAGESTSAGGVQDRAKTEILQLVARLYEHRGDEAEYQQVLADYPPMPSDLALPEWG